MEFSSTATYANRYDLDQYDVFMTGDSTNPMFFSVNGLPPILNYGKHYFNLSVLNTEHLQYQFSRKSKILFEFKSSNDVVLKSDATTANQKNGVITCFVEVLQNPLRTYRDIDDGQGTLTIVGSIEDKPGRTTIPDKFKGAMNYKCIWPIEIRKNLVNAQSPRVLQSSHKLESTQGLFSFVKASISTRRNAPNGMTYDAQGLADSTYTGGETE
jgi:hypothetical protein